MLSLFLYCIVWLWSLLTYPLRGVLETRVEWSGTGVFLWTVSHAQVCPCHWWRYTFLYHSHYWSVKCLWRSVCVIKQCWEKTIIQKDLRIHSAGWEVETPNHVYYNICDVVVGAKVPDYWNLSLGGGEWLWFWWRSHYSHCTHTSQQPQLFINIWLLIISAFSE